MAYTEPEGCSPEGEGYVSYTAHDWQCYVYYISQEWERVRIGS